MSGTASGRRVTEAMKILIGYDGTKEAGKLLRSLDRAGLPARAQVKLLSMVKPWARFEGGPKPGFPDWPGAAAREQYRRQLGLFVDSARKAAGKAAQALAKRFPGWTVTADADLDDPAHGLITRAEAWKADLIVVGSHGRGLLGRALLGSVSEKVVRHAPSGVLVARAGGIARDYPPRVLVGIDGSAGSLRAAEAAARRHWPEGTQFRLLAVLPIANFEAAYWGAVAGAPAQLPGAELRPWLEKRLAMAGKAYSSRGLIAQKEFHVGDPRRTLLKEAKAWKADILFLGSTGTTGLERLLLGSVSSALAAHASCAVEIVRRGKARIQS